MARTILISLPVTDVSRSAGFYNALGFIKNPQSDGASAAFLTLGETIQLVLLSHDEWGKLTARPIAPSTMSEVGLAVYYDSREEVDSVHDAAVAHGGSPDINPVDDYPFMYGRDFADPDGHIWGAKWMDHAAMEAAMQDGAQA